MLTNRLYNAIFVLIGVILCIVVRILIHCYSVLALIFRVLKHLIGLVPGALLM